MDLRNLSTALNHCKLKNRLQTNAAVAWLGFGILRRTVFLKGRVLPVFVAYPVVDPGLFFRFAGVRKFGCYTVVAIVLQKIRLNSCNYMLSL